MNISICYSVKQMIGSYASTMQHTSPTKPERAQWEGEGAGRVYRKRGNNAMPQSGKILACTLSRTVVVAVCWLLKNSTNMHVYLRDGSAQTILRAATLR